MVYPSAKPELVVQFVCGKLMRRRHQYYPRLSDEESGQF
jgi:hypothetical protein